MVLLQRSVTYMGVREENKLIGGIKMSYQTTADQSFGLTAGNATPTLRGFFAGVMQAVMANSAGARRLESTKALQARTDVELGALKIQRDGIVHHVFKDRYYA